MPPNTPSFAKGRIKAALKAIVDPELKPREVDAVWHFFDSSCAYCGALLARNNDRGGGDMDHLISVKSGGINHISNRVLSCSPCNAQEKLDGDWEVFLRGKCEEDDALYTARHAKILEWVNKNGTFELSNHLQTVLDEEVARLNTEMDGAVSRLRALRK